MVTRARTKDVSLPRTGSVHRWRAVVYRSVAAYLRGPADPVKLEEALHNLLPAGEGPGHGPRLSRAPAGSCGSKACEGGCVVATGNEEQAGSQQDLETLARLAEEYEHALGDDERRAEWLQDLQAEYLRRRGHCIQEVAQRLETSVDPASQRMGEGLERMLEADLARFGLQR